MSGRQLLFGGAIHTSIQVQTETNYLSLVYTEKHPQQRIMKISKENAE